MAPEKEAVTETPPADAGDSVESELIKRLPEGTGRVLYCDRPVLRRSDFIDRYVAWWIRHPDPGSRFEKRTRWLRALPDMALISLLRLGRYDGLIYHHGENVVTHIFYVQKGEDVHPFSLAVSDDYQGLGLAKWLFLYFVLEYAPTLQGARRCRVGADGHWLPIFVAEYIKQREGRLNVSIDADNWVTFHDDPQG